MKYLVIVYAEDSTDKAFECHVIADNPGAAMEKMKQHLVKEGKRDLAFELKTAIDIGACVEPGMLVIE